MTRIAKRLLDPVFRLWSPLLLLRAEIATDAFPKPEGPPEVRIAGPDPDRVLVIGGGIVVGYGVLSHDLGLIGHLARQVSRATGRGVEVDILADPELALSEVPGMLSGRNLSTYDAIILLVGVADALKRTPARSWRRMLSALMKNIFSRTAAGAHVFVAAVQPVRLITTFNNRIGWLAELHGRTLNRESIKVCTDLESVTFIPFHPQATPSERYRDSLTYQTWAAQLSPAVTRVLARNHPMGEFVI